MTVCHATAVGRTTVMVFWIRKENCRVSSTPTRRAPGSPVPGVRRSGSRGHSGVELYLLKPHLHK
jgi:hypothetical protein